MKRNSLLFILLAFFFACEEERMLGIGGSRQEGADESVPVQFNMALELRSDTEYVPMSRATETLRYVTMLNKSNPYILLKLVNDGWYIDRIENLTIYNSPYLNLLWPADTSLPSFSLELRPGTYRLVVCLNGDRLVRDMTYQAGSRVADKTTAPRDFPCLWTYLLVSNDQQPLLSREPFSGYVEFTVTKNEDLHTDEPVRSFKVPLTRKAAQFQFLMKDAPGKDANISQTSYWLRATLKASAGKPFCEGLNVLGLPYFNKEKPCMELSYYGSTSPASPSSALHLENGWRTDSQGRQYQAMEPGSTNPAYFWLADPDDKDGVPFEVDDIVITGQSQGFWYKYGGKVSRILKANQACGIAFESSGHWVQDLLFDAQLATDDAGRTLEEPEFLFPPYYIWNQDLFVTEKIKED